MSTGRYGNCKSSYDQARIPNITQHISHSYFLAASCASSTSPSARASTSDALSSSVAQCTLITYIIFLRPAVLPQPINQRGPLFVGAGLLPDGRVPGTDPHVSSASYVVSIRSIIFLCFSSLKVRLHFLMGVFLGQTLT